MPTYKLTGLGTGASLTSEQIDQLGYFINDWLRRMGFGEEYRKLVSFVNELYRSGIDFPERYREIHLVIDYGTRRS